MPVSPERWGQSRPEEVRVGAGRRLPWHVRVCVYGDTCECVHGCVWRAYVYF